MIIGDMLLLVVLVRNWALHCQNAALEADLKLCAMLAGRLARIGLDLWKNVRDASTALTDDDSRSERNRKILAICEAVVRFAEAFGGEAAKRAERDAAIVRSGGSPWKRAPAYFTAERQQLFIDWFEAKARARLFSVQAAQAWLTVAQAQMNLDEEKERNPGWNNRPTTASPPSDGETLQGDQTGNYSLDSIAADNGDAPSVPEWEEKLRTVMAADLKVEVARATAAEAEAQAWSAWADCYKAGFHVRFNQEP